MVCPTTAQSEKKFPGWGPLPPMVMVALAMLPIPLLHSPGTAVTVPFCQVMLLDTVCPDVYQSIVIGCAEYPVVQLKVNVAFTNT